MGPVHRVVSSATWLGVAPWLPLEHPWQILAGAVVAGAAGNGRCSPDCDQAYYATGKLIPGGHREITHFWLLPAVVLLAGMRAGAQGWWVMAIAVAWLAHDALDAPFGRVPVWIDRKGRWIRAGCRLKTGGRVERWLVMPAGVAAVGVLTLWDAWGVVHGPAGAALRASGVSP